jgi:hypothetical protein
MENKENDNVLVVGFVGHCSIEHIARIKKQVEQLSDFKIVFFKTSSDKLWIKEGEQ